MEIKKMLHIKTIIGTSQNSVMIQIWTALNNILLVNLMKETTKYGCHISNMIAFTRLNIFVKINLQKWLDRSFVNRTEP